MNWINDSITGVSGDDYRYYDKIAREKRADTFAEVLSKLAKAVSARAGRWLDRRRERRFQRQTYTALNRLDSSQLKDIGLTRGDVTAIKAGYWPQRRGSQVVGAEVTPIHPDSRNADTHRDAPVSDQHWKRAA